jgi:hypothetical protein
MYFCFLTNNSFKVELEGITADQLTGRMVVEIQSTLQEKNPSIVWLTPMEVREIMERNQPFK